MTVEARNTSNEGSSAENHPEAVEYIVTKAVDEKFDKFLESVKKASDITDNTVKVIRNVSIIIPVFIGIIIVLASFYAKFFFDKGRDDVADLLKRIDEKATIQIKEELPAEFRRKYKKEMGRLALADSERTLLGYRWLGTYSRPIIESHYIELFEEILKGNDKYSSRLLTFMKRLFEYNGEREEHSGSMIIFRETPVDKDIRRIRESENIRKAIDELCESGRRSIQPTAIRVRMYYYAHESFDKTVKQLSNILDGEIQQDTPRYMEDDVEDIVISLAFRVRNMEDSYKKDVLALAARMEKEANDLSRRVAGILSRLLLKMPGGFSSSDNVDLSGELATALHAVIGDDKERIHPVLDILASHVDVLHTDSIFGGHDHYIVTPELVAKLYFEYMDYLSENGKVDIQVSLKSFATNERFYVKLVPAVLRKLRPTHNIRYFVRNLIPDSRILGRDMQRIPILYAVLESGERIKIKFSPFEEINPNMNIIQTEDESRISHEWLKKNGGYWRVYFVTNPYFEDKEW
uniref:Uncharacterized protein n=1 Tax=Candidatus Kentrum sp. LFY TaxID=2126342 RepID=A0A450UMP0_9GAMM|nr:MAG: hypothetical protein BECKLFY1418B_GA0070995_10504 [Candidatus Kentron sp. LFY]